MLSNQSTASVAFYVIEHGVPAPPAHKPRSGRPPLEHGWDRLEVGDSMLVPDHESARPAINWAKRHGRRFTCRSLKTKPFPVRIWRVE